MPTLRQLEYLVAIADTRNFRRAAERANTSQPTLSEQLKALEQQLGTQLVERSRSNVVLTPVGAEVVTIARRMLGDAQEIRALALSHSGSLAGVVKVGLSPTIGPYLLPRVVPELKSHFPDLKLYVREEYPATLARGLEDGAFDIIITQLPVRGTDLVTEQLYREPIFVAMPSDHPLAGRKPLMREDLAGQEVLALGPAYQLHEIVVSLCEELGARLRFDYEGTSLDTLREMVATGLGITFLPALYVRTEVGRDPNLIVQELHGRHLYRMIGMLWRKTSSRNDSFQQFARIVRDAIQPDVTPQLAVANG